MKRAVARSRANFSGRGISAGDSGSSEAVLLGLFEESDSEREQRERLDAIRSELLNDELADQKQRNLLELNEKQSKNPFGGLF